MYINDKNLITKLQNLANEVVNRYDDDFCGGDYSGGNYDDAWDSGIEDGMRILAREILPHLVENP